LKRIRITTILCSLSLFFQAGSAIAQNVSAQRKDSPIITEDANPRLKSPITMRAQDASLAEVLKVLSDRSGMNFVTGEGVYKEKITIILNNTPVDEAIDLVVRAAGLSYEIIGNSVLIAEPDKLNRGEVGQQGYVIKLKYAEATEVASMLGDLTKYVKVDKGGNRLVCFTSPRIISEIERIVKSIDHAHIMVMLETRLIEVQVTKDNKYGIDWARLTPVVSGLAHPDVALKNEWVLLHPTTGPGSGGSSGQNGVAGNSNGSMGIDLALDMMITNGDARLLMASKLTTTNNRPASLQIGEITPYEVQSYNLGAGGGGGASITVQKEETGIKINMEPHVNENNQVTIKVEPEVSNIIQMVGRYKDLPQVQTRKTSTTVRVKDGQTVFLAGLLREEESVNITKVPVLGDIPLIGLLFQNKREKKIKTNLILEITPRILQDSADIAGVAATGTESSAHPEPEASTSAQTTKQASQQPQTQQQSQQPAPVKSAAQPSAPQAVAPGAAQPATNPATVKPVSPAGATPPAAGQQPATPVTDQQKKESR
jgi:general secretion pathway protein D